MAKRFLSLVLLLVILQGTSCKKATVMRPSRPEPERAYDIFLAIDQSGSMLTTDPQELRIKAAKYFIDYFASFSRKDSQNRIGLINFGTEAPPEIQFNLARIKDAEAARALKAQCRSYARADWDTSFIQAFSRVKALYENKNPSREPVLILFTDGEPDDSRRRRQGMTTARYFQELEAFAHKNLFQFLQNEEDTSLTAFKIFVIGFDTQNLFWERNLPYWRRIAGAGAFRIARASQEEMNQVYGKIAEELIATVPGEWRDLSDGVETVKVPPYTEKLSISVLRRPGDPRILLEIHGPAGSPIRLDDSQKVEIYQGEGFDIYTLLSPEVGNCRLRLLGSGKVRIKSDILPIEFRLLTPSLRHPQGEPMRLTASFLKKEGTPVVQLDKYPLSFEATLTIPTEKGGVKNIYKTFVQDASRKGYYVIPEKFETPIAGTYRVKAEVKMLTMDRSFKELMFSRTTEIAVGPFVYFRPTSPIPERETPLYRLLLPWRIRPLKIEGHLYRNRKVQRFEDHFEGNRETAVLCQVQDEAGQVVHRPALVNLLSDLKETRLFGRTLEGIHRPGRYRLISAVKSRLKSDGSPYAFRAQYDFSVGRGSLFDPSIKAPNGYVIFGHLILLIYLVLGMRMLLALLFRSFRGRLRGKLFVGGQTVPLSNTLVFNKLKIRKREGAHFPRFCQRKVNAPKCPTFWAIGGKGGRLPGANRRDSAVWIFSYRQVPFWKKLTRRNPGTNLEGVAIRWSPE